MRISDWSSDVCSSDLVRARPRIALRHRLGPFGGDERIGRAVAKAGPQFFGDKGHERMEHVEDLVEHPARDRLRLIIHRALDQLEIPRSEEHASELQSLMLNSYAVLCLQNKKQKQTDCYHRAHNNT